jgi:hypothetical protein
MPKSLNNKELIVRTIHYKFMLVIGPFSSEIFYGMLSISGKAVARTVDCVVLGITNFTLSCHTTKLGTGFQLFSLVMLQCCLFSNFVSYKQVYLLSAIFLF